MDSKEILETRRSVGRKLYRRIRQNYFQLIKVKNFSERPYYDGDQKYKFSTANYLRLLAAKKNTAMGADVRLKIFRKNTGR